MEQEGVGKAVYWDGRTVSGFKYHERHVTVFLKTWLMENKAMQATCNRDGWSKFDDLKDSAFGCEAPIC